MAAPRTTTKVQSREWAAARAAWCRWVPVREIAARLGCGESNVRERARVEGWPARRQPRTGGRAVLPYRVVETCERCGARVTTAFGIPADCPGCTSGPPIIRSQHYGQEAA